MDDNGSEGKPIKVDERKYGKYCSCVSSNLFHFFYIQIRTFEQWTKGVMSAWGGVIMHVINYIYL